MTTLSKHDRPVAPNLLDRKFNPESPNQYWAADITYVASRDGWLYLSGVMDLASRKIVGWSLDRSLRTEGAKRALDRALVLRRPGRGLIHHSDQGVQYASGEYTERLNAVGGVPSMSRKGNCWDNAVMESFFSTLKTECIHGPFNSFEEAEGKIGKWIEGFYNPRRLHSSLGYMSPVEYEAELATRFRGTLVDGKFEELAAS